MDLDEPELSRRDRRRFRRRHLLGNSKVPILMLVPNFFTLLSLCAGVTGIRMAIEQRYDIAVLLIVAAAVIDGIDGRLARALKAQSRLGAELDSLADFVNFGVAPAIVVYTWGLGTLRDFGWIAVLCFACCMGLRLARFNSMLDVEKPRWQSNYFTGIPAPAGAITVLLPLYLEKAGILDVLSHPRLIAAYTLALAFMLVSTIPTFSGKLMGERIRREWVPSMLGGLTAFVGCLIAYPYIVMSLVAVGYLAIIPLGWRRWRWNFARDADAAAGSARSGGDAGTTAAAAKLPGIIAPATETKH